MEDLSKSEFPPEPRETGVAHFQREQNAEELQALITAHEGGLEPLQLSDAIREVLKAGVRGRPAMYFLYSGTQRLEVDLNETRDERREAQAEAARWRDQFYSERERASVLMERLSTAVNLAPLQSLLLTLGGAVLGLAGSFLEDSNLWGGLGIALGLILLIGGWQLRVKRGGG